MKILLSLDFIHSVGLWLSFDWELVSYPFDKSKSSVQLMVLINHIWFHTLPWYAFVSCLPLILYRKPKVTLYRSHVRTLGLSEGKETPNLFYRNLISFLPKSSMEKKSFHFALVGLSIPATPYNLILDLQQKNSQTLTTNEPHL